MREKALCHMRKDKKKYGDNFTWEGREIGLSLWQRKLYCNTHSYFLRNTKINLIWEMPSKIKDGISEPHSYIS